MHEPWGERKKANVVAAFPYQVTRYICATVHWQIVLSLIWFLAPEDVNNMYGMTHFVHSVERGLSVTAILITLPHGQPHAVSRPSSQWFCLVQPPKHSCLKSVPKHEWKRSSYTQSVSVFRRGVTALSSQILFLCFLGFWFPSGHDTFSVPIGHLFPIFGAELKRYLSCNSCVPTQRCTFTRPCGCGQN